MKYFIKELKRHIIIYFIFVKNCMIAQMEFRVNFIAGIAVESGYLMAKVLYAVVVYRAGVSIKGLSPDAVLIFIGTYVLMTGFYVGFFFDNFRKLPISIWDGSFDFYITKPVSLQFISTMRYMDFGMPIPNIVGGITMIVIGWSRIGLPVTAYNILGFIGFVIGGIVLNYAVFLFPVILSFWTVKIRGVFEISDALWDFNNMPMGIYEKWMQSLGIFIIPIFLISNFSPLVALGKLNGFYILWGCSAPFLYLIVTRIFWKFAVKHYHSASS